MDFSHNYCENILDSMTSCFDIFGLWICILPERISDAGGRELQFSLTRMNATLGTSDTIGSFTWHGIAENCMAFCGLTEMHLPVS